ncbi:MAG: alpha/beta hydrolase [Hyphomonas sp.]|nr:alpha/beta hydrolase [Hyphomonas sp.]
MNTRALVDKELLPVLNAMPEGELPESVLMAALRDPQAFPLNPAIVADADSRSVDDTVVFVSGHGERPDVALRVMRPESAKGLLPCVYHIHGGGYVGGSSAQLAPLHRRLAQQLNCVVVSVDYRLAPEHPYPAAIEDCYAGVAWVFANADELSIDRTRIGVKGESAGGGLAAALALMVRDRGEFELAFQHLIYPMLDDRSCIAGDPNPFTGEFIWTRAANRFGWRSLLGAEPGGPDVSPYAAPARATELAGLPPAYIAVPALDLFVDEVIEYARRLIRSGVPVDMRIFSGGFHGFDIFGGAADVVTRARQESVDAIARAIAQ